MFVVNCWPSENGSSCDVNIEYELEDENLELNDVSILIPVPWVSSFLILIFLPHQNISGISSPIPTHYPNDLCQYLDFGQSFRVIYRYRSSVASPVVNDCDGEYHYDSRKNHLEWKLPVIDSGNKSGSMEFSIAGKPDDFFPVTVSFYSKKSICNIEVRILFHSSIPSDCSFHTFRSLFANCNFYSVSKQVWSILVISQQSCSQLVSAFVLTVSETVTSSWVHLQITLA